MWNIPVSLQTVAQYGNSITSHEKAVDNRGGAILVLLDFSAAFDTIDHETIIRTFDTYCGI